MEETRDEFVSNIIDKLQNLAHCNIHNEEELRTNGQEFLCRLYFAGVEKIEYTDDEKKAIISLFPSASKALKEYFSELSTRFLLHTVRSLKLQRYGFQFLYNFLKDCAAKLEDNQERKILEETIEEIMQSDDMAELDGQVKNVIITMFDECPDNDVPNPFLTG